MKLRVCRRCGTAVNKSEVIGYKYYCPNHDEDLFEFETYLIDIPGIKSRKNNQNHKENKKHESTPQEHYRLRMD